MHPDKQKRQPRQAPTYDGDNIRKVEQLAYEWWHARDYVPLQLSVDRKAAALGYRFVMDWERHIIRAVELDERAGQS